MPTGRARGSYGLPDRFFEYPREQRLGIDPVGLTGVIELETMPQRRDQHGPQIVEAHIVAVLKQGMALRGKHQALCAARAHAETNVLLDLGMRIGAIGLRAPGEACPRATDMIRDRHRAGEFLATQYIVGGEYLRRHDCSCSRGEVKDVVELVLAWKCHHGVEEKAV